MKTCPACAEDVKSAAVICRFCGYDFDAARMLGRSAGGGWSARDTRALKVLLVLLALGGAVGLVDASMKDAERQADEACAITGTC